MQEYKKLLKNEVAGFREMGHQFLEGKVTKNEFKGRSGGMGVYAQQDQKSFMIRLRTPSGIITKAHLRLILKYAHQYSLPKVHLTTRQAVQLHDLSIDDVCDIMLNAIDHDLFTRGGGGNFPRNVSLSPLAGVEQGEAFDVTPYAVQAGQYFLKNATGYHLPRKLKAGFSSGQEDTANASVNDIGFMAVLDNGKPMFRMWIAGGLGGGPAAAISYDELVKPEDVLYYIEALVQTFMAEGDYENKAKARIRFIPRRMGEDAFLECYRSHLKDVKERFEFTEITPVIETETAQDTLRTPVLIAQKQNELYTAVLHPSCGQLLTEDLEIITAFADKIEAAEIRISMEEDMYIRNLTRSQAEQQLETLGEQMMKTPVQMSLSCIGTPTCQMGILQSQKLYRAISKAVEKEGLLDCGLPMIHISGCPNSCARHQIADIGFAGRKVKKDNESRDAFTLYTGGKATRDDTHLGEAKGILLADEIPEFIVKTGELLNETGMDITELIHETCFQDLVEKYKV